MSGTGKDILEKVNISWYPGHMFKTKKELQQDINLTDLVIEILDARIPRSSRNPDIVSMTKNKKRIIVLNKEDLADPKVNLKWREELQKEAPTILLNSEKEQDFSKILKMIDELMADKIKKDKEKGIKLPLIRLMILGVPNVGKSSFINRMAKRKTMEVGNKPRSDKEKSMD